MIHATINEMLEAADALGVDPKEIQRTILVVEAGMSVLAERIAEKAGVVHADTKFDHAGGIMSSFTARTPGQQCPEAIQAMDPGGELELGPAANPESDA